MTPDTSSSILYTGAVKAEQGGKFPLSQIPRIPSASSQVSAAAMESNREPTFAVLAACYQTGGYSHQLLSLILAFLCPTLHLTSPAQGVTCLEWDPGQL